MIQNLKTQNCELTMLGGELQLAEDSEVIKLQVEIGIEEHGVPLFNLEVEFDLEGNELRFGFLDADFYGLSEPELIIMQANIVEKLLKRSEGEETYSFLKKFRLKLVTMGHAFREITEDEPKIIELYRGKSKTLDEYLADREEARKELTYFEKHAPVRADITTFVQRMGKAQTTERTYYYALEKFFEYVIVQRYETYPRFDELVINEFIQTTYRVDEKSAYYVNRLVAAIMAFADFLEGEGMHAAYFQKPINRKLLQLPKIPRLAEIQPRSLDKDQIYCAEEYLHKRYSVVEERVKRGGTGCYSAYRDSMRNLFLFRVLLYGGLRISEALALDFDDVKIGESQKTSYFVVRGKGGKARRVPILPEIREDLKTYIAWRKQYDVFVEFEKEMRHLNTGRKKIEHFLTAEELKTVEKLDQEKELLDEKENEWKINYLSSQKNILIEDAVMNYVKERFNQEEMQALFVSNRSRRVAANTVQVMFKELGKKKRRDPYTGKLEAYDVGIFGVQAQELRNTCLKRLVDRNVPPKVIQLFSGNESSDMVMRYADMLPFEELVEQMEGALRKKE